MGPQDKNPIAMPLLLGHSSLPTAAGLSLTHGAKVATQCLSGKYVKCAMVIFTHRGYSSPFVSEFLDGDGFLILFGHIVSFFAY